MAFKNIFNWLGGGRAKSKAASAAKNAPLAVVISGPGVLREEHEIVERLFAAGMARFHLRKPDWTPARVREWVKQFPERHYPRLVVHAQHGVVREFGLGGLHLRSSQERPPDWPHEIPVSQSCHSYGDLLESARGCSYATIGPIFPSVSKHGYASQRTPEEYAVIVEHWREEKGTCPLLALGGLTTENIARARAIGFDGFAVVGAVWEAQEPVEAFKKLLAAWKKK